MGHRGSKIKFSGTRSHEFGPKMPILMFVSVENFTFDMFEFAVSQVVHVPALPRLGVLVTEA